MVEGKLNPAQKKTCPLGLCFQGHYYYRGQLDVTVAACCVDAASRRGVCAPSARVASVAEYPRDIAYYFYVTGIQTMVGGRGNQNASHGVASGRSASRVCGSWADDWGDEMS